MNPASNEQSGMNLPPPIGEAGAVLPAPMEGQSAAPEALPFAPERAVANAQPVIPQMAAMPPIMPLPTQPPVTQTDVVTTTPTSTPTMADDSDLIEKEWVTKAKQIVERTREDPNQQSKELTAFKADYLQKRYNKTIKTSE